MHIYMYIPANNVQGILDCYGNHFWPITSIACSRKETWLLANNWVFSILCTCVCATLINAVLCLETSARGTVEFPSNDMVAKSRQYVDI